MKNEKVFVLILARGGSKRIPRKALQKLDDKITLLENAIKIGLETALPVFVSSEDEEILNIAKKANANTILRPIDLANDTATSVDAAIHAVNKVVGYESVILLQVTNPSVKSADILQAYVKHMEIQKAIFAATRFSNVFWAWKSSEPLFPIFQEVRSQDLPPAFLPAGAFFITHVKSLKEYKSFFKPNAVPFEIQQGIDIDTPSDLELARFLWHQR